MIVNNSNKKRLLRRLESLDALDFEMGERPNDNCSE